MTHRTLGALAAVAVVMGAAGAANAAVVYKLDVTTSYGSSYGGPAGTSLGGGTPSPDTGFLTFTNSGPSTFTGTLGYTAAPGSGGADESFSASVTLAPGASDYFAIGNESSNQGGFNGPTNSTQPGVIIFANGTFDATAANLSVNDADVHSGVAQTNPFGVVVDSWVLQGGDPLGRDTGDAFETAQSHGLFTFELDTGAVPEPSTWATMLMGLFAVGGALRMFRRRDAAAFVA